MNLYQDSSNWEKERSDKKQGFAIVGIGCRFPGAADRPETYLNLLRSATCAISEAPDGRWNSDNFYSDIPDAPQRSITKWAGFVPNVTEFDAELFGISPREAEAMDPQQRLLLQVTWEAFEDAGIAPDSLAGSNTGVFIGIAMDDYKSTLKTVPPDTDISHMATGLAMSIASNRISHKLDFHGPSLSVDTACSSSLVATDLAAKALRAGDCDMAVVGGVTILLDPGAFVSFSKARMVSPTGRVLTFDQRADGFVRAEGAGIVLLKRLDDALENGDKIYAVLLGSGVNSDGHTSTLTVPNADAQASLFREVCRRAGVSPDEVDYVEAHGTGTPVGDPIEAHAIGQVFGSARDSGDPILVGSVKSNIGHLEAGAGVAGMIKAALSLKHEQTFANPNFETISPTIPLDRLNMEVATEMRAWPAGETPRRAVVNSFGFGGTNACVVLEEAPNRLTEDPVTPLKEKWVVPVSAATKSALSRLAENVASEIETQHAISAHDAFATLAMDRAALPERLAIVANSKAEVIKRLRSFSEGVDGEYREGRMPSLFSGRSSDTPKIAFAFSGQGSQWHGMARHLIANDKVFLEGIREADSEIQKQSGWSALEEIGRQRSDSRIDLTRITQGCIFAVQVGLANRWLRWGVRPDMIFGHSLGEIAAAFASGALSLSDAVTVLHYRSLLQTETEGTGSIYAVGLSAEAVQEQLIEAGEDRVELAAINSNQMVTIAGESHAMKTFLARLREVVGPDLYRSRIRMNFAPHSPQMDPLRERFLDGVSGIAPRDATDPLISTVTGDLIEGGSLDPEYWWRNMRFPVLFQNAIQTSLEQGAGVFLEVGPDSPLSGLIATCAGELGEQPQIVPSQKRGRNDEFLLRSALARLFVAGVRPDWGSIYTSPYKRLDIGRYPFEQKEYWLDGGRARQFMNEPMVSALLGRRVNGPEPAWENTLSLAEHPYLKDHKVNGSYIFPAAGYFEVMFAACRDMFGDGPIELVDVQFTKANFLDPERSELFLTRYDPGRRRINIFSRPADAEDEWDLRAHGTVNTATFDPVDHKPPQRPEKPDVTLSGKDFYSKASEYGYVYGKGFRGIKNLEILDNTTWARLSFKKSEAKAPGFLIHPSVLDSVLQIAIAKIFDSEEAKRRKEEVIYLPRSASRIRFERPMPSRFDVVVQQNNANIASVKLDKTVYNSRGEPVIVLEEYTSAAVQRSEAAEPDGAKTEPHFYVDDSVPSRLPETVRLDKGIWLIFCDTGGIGINLARRLRKEGHRPLIVTRGKPFQDFKNDRCTIDPAHPGEFGAVVDAALKLKETIFGSLFLWSCDVTHAFEDLSAEELQAVSREAVFPALDLVQALIAHSVAGRLMFVTKGAKILAQETQRHDYAGIALSPLLGMARTAYSEYPELGVTTLDLDPVESSAARHARIVMGELLAVEQQRETEIAYRDGGRFVPRFAVRNQSSLSPMRVPAQSSRGRYGFELQIPRPGDLEDLSVKEVPETDPKDGEVAIGVRAVGMNFRDIMAATGLLPLEAESDPAWMRLGMECSGVVEKIGPGVTGLKAGDPVITSYRGCFKSSINQIASGVRKTPDGMQPIEAATLLSAFSTAYYGLITQARLEKGERVLVHLGTGGVGLAAIQIAQMIGAEIFATAGSERKRAYLRNLGIEHVMNSRTLDFANEIHEITGGKGVDVVLNALSGEALQRSLDVLAPCGRFVEIGKRDVYADSAIGLKVLRKNISFFAIDMAQLGDHNPRSLTRVFTEIAELIQNGVLSPLPAETFPLNRAEDAFTRMAKGEHIGKIVVTVDPKDVLVSLSDEAGLSLDAKGAYLVTGGLSGFGMAVAQRLAERGAGHIYLMSRSGASTKTAKAGLKAIRKTGVKASVLKGDVSLEAHVKRVFARIQDNALPLRGVIHAAVAYDDALITKLNHQRLETVFAPKVQGAWNLHRATVDLDLDFFALFSSQSTPLGNVGQANYVAANMFMETVARYRQAIGLPGLCIAWGVMETGEVQRNPELRKLFVSSGVPPMSVEQALAGLEIMLRKSDPNIAYIDIDWQKYAIANGHIFAQPRLVGEAVSSRTSGDRQAYHETMAAPPTARPAIIARHMTEAIAKVLKVDPEKIQPDTSLQDIGLDSLTSFQLKNRAEAEFDVSLQVSNFLQKPTVRKLSDLIGKALERETVDTGNGAIRSQQGSALQLSRRQLDILAGIQMHHGNNCYQMSHELSGCITVNPRIDLQLLRDGIARLVEENPVIASRFPVKKGRRVFARCSVEQMTAIEDCLEMDNATFEEHLHQTVMEPLDVAKGPLFEIRVFRRSQDKDTILFRAHAAIMDGPSFVLALEFTRKVFGGGSDRLLTMATSLRYDDFAEWQRKFVSSPKGRTQLLYWQKKLQRTVEPLALPYDRQRCHDMPRSTGYHTVDLSARVREKLKRLAASEKTSVFAVLMAAFAQLLRPYAHGNDLLITTTATARTRTEFEGTIGPLSNTVVVRLNGDPQTDDKECLAETALDLKEAIANQDYPSASLRRDLGLTSTPKSALDQVAFRLVLADNDEDPANVGVLANMPGARSQMTFGGAESVVLPARGIRRDLSVYMQEHSGRITVRLEYDADLFDPPTIEQLANRYVEIASEFGDATIPATAEPVEIVDS